MKSRKERTMSKNDYFEIDAISASMIKTTLKQSPVHAVERAKSLVPSPQMKLGTAFHAALLEPENWQDLIAVSPECDRRTKAGKETYAKFQETAEDKIIITAEQNILLDGMLDSAKKHPEVKRLLEVCYAIEFQTCFEYDGEKCKAMIDAVSDGEHKTIVDVKTAQDASPEGFARASANYLYHVQLAWYVNAMDWLEYMETFADVSAYIIAIENTAPFGCAVYKFSPEALQRGWELCKEAVTTIKQYQKDPEVYAAYSNEVNVLELPRWAESKKNIEL